MRGAQRDDARHDGDDATGAPPAPHPAPRPCRQCGYDVTGLDPAGLCPECGFEIARSLASDELKNSAPEYVASLHRGLVIVLTAITLILILGVAFFVFAFALALSGAGPIPAWVETLNQGVNTLLSLVLVYGWWMLSAPDPAYTGRADGSNARRVLRVALCVAVATNLVTLGFMLTPIAGNAMLALFGFMLLGLVVFAVRFFAEMQYLRWLAPRIPSREHYQSAGRLMWLGPVLYTVGAACFGIGPIVALALYIVLLNNVRRDIKIIRQTVPGMSR